jgi:hypothetical protein
MTNQPILWVPKPLDSVDFSGITLLNFMPDIGRKAKRHPNWMALYLVMVPI